MLNEALNNAPFPSDSLLGLFPYAMQIQSF